jgi:diaminopimelate decarboxylase
MHDFEYRGGRLFCEGVSLESLARQHGTPLYVYSQRTLSRHFAGLRESLSALDPLVCYAVKANSNLALLRVLATLGSGFDIVSEGELRRVLAAGGLASKCVFAGVGKTGSEIEFALKQGVFCFNVESEAELVRIDRIAGRLGMKAPIAIRANPNIDAGTHAKITTGTYANKFGIAYESLERLYARASRLKHLHLRGLQMHIGSQLTEVKPFELAVRRLLPLVPKLAARHGLEFFSLGGGLGIVYDPALESGPVGWWRGRPAARILTPATYASALVPLLKPLGLRILLEPGRFIVGNAGVLVARVEYVKQTARKRFVIVDAAMNDLIRPAFYDSFHEIVPLRQTGGRRVSCDVVGPICESSDFFAKDRRLPALGEGDYLALLSAGAYGFVMASNYNSRPMAAEVLVHGRQHAVVRPRQELADLWSRERFAPWQPAV